MLFVFRWWGWDRKLNDVNAFWQFIMPPWCDSPCWIVVFLAFAMSMATILHWILLMLPSGKVTILATFTLKKIITFVIFRFVSQMLFITIGKFTNSLPALHNKNEEWNVTYGIPGLIRPSNLQEKSVLLLKRLWYCSCSSGYTSTHLPLN